MGLNHRTSPLEVREQLSLTKAQLPEALQAMAEHGVPGVILCTCNRSEFYAMEPGDETTSAMGRQSSEQRIKQFLADRFNVSLMDLDQFLYVYRGRQCVNHLFRVASSLDSMILGEGQIIGQVRESFEVAGQSDTLPMPVFTPVPMGSPGGAQGTPGNGHRPKRAVGQPGMRRVGEEGLGRLAGP